MVSQGAKSGLFSPERVCEDAEVPQGRRGRVGLADARADRFLAWLDASFDASIAREEDEAASDLALSLRQDRSAFLALRRAGPLEVVMPDGAPASVSHLGRDYLATSPPAVALLPLDGAIVAVMSRGTRPRVRDRSLAEVLHALARNRAWVELTTNAGLVSGRIVVAASDHLELDGVVRRLIVGRDAIRVLRPSLEDSTDVP